MFKPTPGEEWVAIRFKPEWTASILGVGSGDHWEGFEDYTEICFDMGGRLLAELLKTRSAMDALRVLAVFAVARSEQARAAGGSMLQVRSLLECLRISKGQQRLGQLSLEMGHTPQYLTRTIRDHLGTTPKKIARLLRLNALVAMADQCSRPDWSALALEGGYCDQAHLSRECKALTGQTPLGLHTERRTGFVLSNTG